MMGRKATIAAEKARGFTHPFIGGSHTALSGFHTPNHGVSPTGGYENPFYDSQLPSYFDSLTFLTVHI